MGGGKGSCKECKGVKVEGKEREGGKERGRGGREGRAHEITASYNLNYNDYLFEPCKKSVQIFFVYLLISCTVPNWYHLKDLEQPYTKTRPFWNHVCSLTTSLIYCEDLTIFMEEFIPTDM